MVRMAALDTYALHTILWKAFPGAKERPFLFRADRQIDEIESGPRPVLALVQSVIEPRWSMPEILSAESHSVERTLSEGERLRFLLRANPTVARKGRKEPKFAGIEGAAFREDRGRRVAVVGDEPRLAWLTRKGGTSGFALAETAGGPPGVRISRAQSVFWSRGSRRARHDGVDFEGVLRVVDAEKLRTAIERGIGSGKAFGFGLLSTARA
jgi:CRISPR system Cascade subunit CasE